MTYCCANLYATGESGDNAVVLKIRLGKKSCGRSIPSLKEGI